MGNTYEQIEKTFKDTYGIGERPLTSHERELMVILNPEGLLQLLPKLESNPFRRERLSESTEMVQ
jgi:hypothetical protein